MNRTSIFLLTQTAVLCGALTASAQMPQSRPERPYRGIYASGTDQAQQVLTIDMAPSTRVENIAITGTPSNGSYQFYVHSFSTPNSSDPFMLHVGNGSQTQTITGTLNPGQNSQTVTIHFPGGG